MKVFARLNPNASPLDQAEFEKIKHEITSLTVGEVGHGYEITHLPDGMSSLRYLSCGYNGEDSVTQEEDKAAGTKLISLPHGMTSLVELYCENNLLISLPSDMHSLRYLFCENNLLTSLPDNMSSLEVLGCGNDRPHMQCNQLLSLPSNMTSLRHLYCQGNKLRSLPHDMVNLQSLFSDFEELGEGDQVQAYHKLREEDNLPFRSSMKSAIPF